MSISAMPETLMHQAGHTADYYLMRAIESINLRCGDGYALKHPELIAAFMQACAADFDTAIRRWEGRNG